MTESPEPTQPAQAEQEAGAAQSAADAAQSTANAAREAVTDDAGSGDAAQAGDGEQ